LQRLIYAAAFGIAATAPLVPAAAQETLGYTYDGRGRLVTVTHSGTANNGVNSCYAYDATDNRTAATVSTSGACTIAGPVTFSISSNGAVTEGANSVFTITKTGTATTSLSVNYATANSTAVAPGDYTAKSGTLTFTTSQTSQTVSVATVNDTTVESAETFKMSLSSPTGGATLGTPSTATATINDNDVAGVCASVSFTVGNAAVTEGGTLVFTVAKSGSTSSSCSVNYATANGSATAGTDYIATSGTLTFSSTQTSKTVSVTTIDNSRLLDRTMYLNLSSPTGGATLSNSQGTGTLLHSGGTGGCTFRCQTPLQSPDSSAPPTDSTTSEPSDSGPPPPGEIGLIDLRKFNRRAPAAERLAAIANTFGWSARS
jgi:hypothetical protein